MTGGQRLAVEDVERRALDSPFGGWLDHRSLVDNRGACDRNDDCFGFHAGEGSGADHALRFRRKWRGDYDIVALGQHFGETVGAVDPVDERVDVVERRAVTFDGEDPHSHGADPGGDGAADVAVADNPDRLAGNLRDVELLPAAGLLIPDHAPEVLGEV